MVATVVPGDRPALIPTTAYPSRRHRICHQSAPLASRVNCAHPSQYQPPGHLLQPAHAASETSDWNLRLRRLVGVAGGPVEASRCERPAAGR